MKHWAVPLALASCGPTPTTQAPETTQAPVVSSPSEPGSRPERLAAPVPTDEPCPHREGEDAMLFEFGDFGPPSMSHDVLGQAWWQWDGEGHAFEGEDGTVWVVVHHEDIDPADLATRFPVREAERCDHRYVSVQRAVTYLDEHITELEDVEGFAAIAAQLRETRAAIGERFDQATQ